MTRVVLVSNRNKTGVAEALKALRPWLSQRAEIAAELDADDREPADVKGAVDLVLVLGGDGTLLSQARRLVDLDAPMLGVNFGKLGFLAEFSLEELQSRWDKILGKQMEISRRLMLQVKVFSAGDASEPKFTSLAMNDCVITAGQPFRMIDLELTINPQQHPGGGTMFRGDGVILATPSGSTAYNASAGGSIVAPDVDAFVITPICPQSLSFRSIMVRGDDEVSIQLHQANAGTTLVIDGQIPQPLTAGCRLHVAAYSKRIKLVTNPAMGYWKRLATKMHWAISPQRQ